MNDHFAVCASGSAATAAAVVVGGVKLLLEARSLALLSGGTVSPLGCSGGADATSIWAKINARVHTNAAALNTAIMNAAKAIHSKGARGTMQRIDIAITNSAQHNRHGNHMLNRVFNNKWLPMLFSDNWLPKLLARG